VESHTRNQRRKYVAILQRLTTKRIDVTKLRESVMSRTRMPFAVLEQCSDILTDGLRLRWCSCRLCGHVTAVQRRHATHRRQIGVEMFAERCDLDVTMCWRSMGRWDGSLWTAVVQRPFARGHCPRPFSCVLQHVL